MELYLMRHGEALPVGGSIPDDSARPLSPAGQAQVQKVAEGLRRHIFALEAVICSPLKRAAETGQILAPVLGVSHVEISDSLAPSTSATGIHAILKKYARSKRILLVGHHPDVTVLTALLTGLDPSSCPLFGTASIAALALEPQQKKATFLWYQTSEQLAQS
jgi:phosphohistidine phosphatase